MPLGSFGLSLLLLSTGAYGLHPGAGRRAPREANDTVVVFVAGLEGTGHTYFDRVFQIMKARVIQLHGNWHQAGMMGEDKAWSPEHIDTNAELLSSAMRNYAGEVVEIRSRSSGSYPNGQGSHEQRLHRRQPSLPLLLEAAKRGGANVQVLVTQREAKDTLAATCLHRYDLEKCEAQAETLAENAKTLAKQLREIDSSNFRCVTYGDLLDLGLGLADVMFGPERHRRAHKAVTSAWQKFSHPEQGRTEADRHVGKMQGAVDELAELCRREHAGAVSGYPALSNNSRVDGILRTILPRRVLQVAAHRKRKS